MTTIIQFPSAPAQTPVAPEVTVVPVKRSKFRAAMLCWFVGCLLGFLLLSAGLSVIGQIVFWYLQACAIYALVKGIPLPTDKSNAPLNDSSQ